jgi:type II secretory pathway pseudopilin PulG
MRRLLLVLFAVGSGLLAVAAATIFAIYLCHAHQLNAYRAELRAKGEPRDILSAAPPRSADSDATEKLLAACAALQEAWKAKDSPPFVLGYIENESDAEGRLPLIIQRDKPQMKMSDVYGPSWEEAAASLEFLDPYLESVRASSKAQNLGVELDYSKGMQALRMFPEAETAAHGLSSHCTLALKSGDAEAATEDIEAQLALVLALQKPIFLTSQMQAILVVNPAWKSTFTLASSGLADASQLARLQARWEKIAKSFQLVSAFRVERAIALPLLDRPDSISFFGSLPNVIHGRASLKEFYKFWRWRVLERDEDYLFFLKTTQGWIDSSLSAEKSGSWLELLRDAQSLDPTKLPFSISFGASTLMTLQRAPDLFVQTQTRALLAATALAIERYKLDHGEYPSALSDLVPKYFAAVPTDPYDGKPLRYKRKIPENFSLFSIGKGALKSLSNTDPDNSDTIIWPAAGDVAEIPERKFERPRIVPKKFVRRIAAPTPTPAQQAPQNTP